MEQKIKQKLQEKIKNKAISIGLNSTVRDAKKGELDSVVYASNLSEDMLNTISKLGVPIYSYEGDSEALSIACSKSFNISILGLKK
ncbi:MAG: ribosomal L7Ae/L30e/S12e/Gadd45 family protein [Candidatus Parvarchaeota archaeon]|jgi:Ribosomal protein L30E|nr:ribosomal L7Ae/L30e/S12e/Gadd45 family protein [Candidatus Parvarchaeota archaeon]